MAVGGFFFNGRYHTRPQIDINVAIQAALGVLNGAYSLVFIGSANDSEPQTLNWLTDVSQALESVQGGRLYTALQMATQPLKGVAVGPSKIATLRVDEATQATGTLFGTGASPVAQIGLTSTSWGVNGNQVAVAVSPGSVSGYLVQVRNDVLGKSVSQDNLARQAFSLYYTGSTLTDITVSVTATELTVSAGATPTVVFTVSFATYTTVAQVVNQINQQANFVATVLTSNPSDASATLDFATNAVVGTTSTAAAIITENLQQVIAWLNSGAQPWVTAVLDSAGGAGLATTGAWVYLSGGTVTAPVTTDWQNAFNLLATDSTVNFIVPLTGQAAVHAMLATHCAQMQAESLWRWGHVGGELGETPAQTLTRAQNLNSSSVMVNWPGVQSSVPTGAAVTYQPYYTAAITAGARAAQGLPLNIENQPLNVLGLEQSSHAYVDELLQGGVAVLDSDVARGTYVVDAIMTTQAPISEITRQEVSQLIVGSFVRDAQANIQAEVQAVASSAGTLTSQTLANLAANAVELTAEDYYNLGLFEAAPDPGTFTAVVSQANAVTVSGPIVVGAPDNFIGVNINASTL